jgi:hypothetical protein
LDDLRGCRGISVANGVGAGLGVLISERSNRLQSFEILWARVISHHFDRDLPPEAWRSPNLLVDLHDLP